MLIRLNNIVGALLPKEYRQQVLGGKTKDIKAVQQRSKKICAQTGNDYLGFLAYNRLMHWHLAHCPGAEARSAWFEAAQAFETDLPQLENILGQQRAVCEALPYNPMALEATYGESRWLPRILADCHIDWVLTDVLFENGLMGNHDKNMMLCFLRLADLLPEDFYLALLPGGPAYLDCRIEERRQQLGRETENGLKFVFDQLAENNFHEIGLRFVAAGVVPRYENLVVCEEDALFGKFRQALTIRGRILKTILGGEDVVFPFSVEPASQEIVALSAVECMVLFRQYYSQGDFLMAMFLKNGWPVGYAASEFFPSQDSFANLGFHVFFEHRGTPSSARFFKAFEEQVVRQQNPCFVMTKLATNQSKELPAERIEHSIDFFFARGFRQTRESTVMAKTLRIF